MDTGDAPVGRATELVGATDDQTAKLKRIKAGKVFGGWACHACNYLHLEFEYMDVVCDECGVDRVALIAGPEVQVRSRPDEQPRRSPDQRQAPHSPTEQDGASFFWKCKSCQYLHSQFENMEFACYDCGAERVSTDLVGNATGSMPEAGLSRSVHGGGSVPRPTSCFKKKDNAELDDDGLKERADLRTVAVHTSWPTPVRNDFVCSSSDQYSPPSPSLSPPVNAASCATPSPAKQPRTTAKREASARKEIWKSMANKNRKLFKPRKHQ